MSTFDIIIPTCDKYLNITRATLFSIDYFWKERPKIIIVGYKNPSYQLPENCEFISLGMDETPGKWSNGLRKFLNWYDKDHFILHMDDHCLVKSVDNEKILAASDIIRRDNSVDKIMLHPFGSGNFPRYEVFTSNLTFFRCQNNVGTTTLMNAIWKKSYMLSLLNDNLNPWDFENQNNRFSINATVLSTHDEIVMISSLYNRGNRNSTWFSCNFREEFVFQSPSTEFINKINSILDGSV